MYAWLYNYIKKQNIEVAYTTSNCWQNIEVAYTTSNCWQDIPVHIDNESPWHCSQPDHQHSGHTEILQFRKKIISETPSLYIRNKTLQNRIIDELIPSHKTTARPEPW